MASAAADDWCALFHIEAHLPVALQYSFWNGPIDASLSTSLVAIRYECSASLMRGLEKNKLLTSLQFQNYIHIHEPHSINSSGAASLVISDSWNSVTVALTFMLHFVFCMHFTDCCSKNFKNMSSLHLSTGQSCRTPLHSLLLNPVTCHTQEASVHTSAVVQIFVCDFL